jgi:hypothetical protein
MGSYSDRARSPGGKENGKLPVTYRDFNEFGVCWDAIGPGIREVEALGFIRVTEEGRAGNGEWRKPNKFALTHLPTVITKGDRGLETGQDHRGGHDHRRCSPKS